MKARHYILIVAAAMLAACDPGHDDDVVLCNKTDVSVTVLPSQRDEQEAYYSRYENYTIAAGEEVVVVNNGGIGQSSRDECEYWLLQYLADSVTFRFADGSEVTYHSDDTTDAISPFNLASELFSYDEKLSTGLWFHDNPYYGRLTFSITKAHLEAARTPVNDTISD